MVSPLQWMNGSFQTNLQQYQAENYVDGDFSSRCLFPAGEESLNDGDTITITCPRHVYAQAPMVQRYAPARIEKARYTYEGMPINVEPKVIENSEIARAKYGNSRFMNVAESMLSMTDEDNSYLQVTNGKARSWCADGVNHYFKQLLGYNPFTNSDRRNLSGVSEIKNWGRKQGLYSSARTSEQISRQMVNMNTGDVLVFQRPRYLQVENDDVYQIDTSHIGVIVGRTQDKVLVLEANTNAYAQNKDGKYPIKETRDRRGRVVKKEIMPVYPDGDRVLLKEYGVNELCSRGYSGYINMQKYVN